MTTKERLKEFIKVKGISYREFCRTVGLSPAYVTAPSVSISPEVLNRISIHFPELNMGWLLAGTGDMLTLQNDKKAHDDENGVFIHNDAWTVIKQQAASLQSRDSAINELITIIRSLNDKSDMVKD